MAIFFRRGTPGEKQVTVDRKGVLSDAVSSFPTSLSVLGPLGTGTEAAGAVTVNAAKGKITLAAVLNAGAGIDVTVTNSLVTTASVIQLTVQGTTATAAATRDALTADITSISAGSFVCHIYNNDAANSSAAPIVHFCVF